MLTAGHLATSYLISQTPRLWGQTLPPPEVLFITISGYVLDLDIFIARFFLKNRASHHLLPTHTPLIVILTSVLGFVFLKGYFSITLLVLSSIALFSHLILDDIGYWFCKWGWQKESKVPQIFWLYPFDKRRNKFIKNRVLIHSDHNALVNYLSKAKVNVVLEILITVIALIVLTHP